MPGSPILYLKAMRILMFQLSGFYCNSLDLERPSFSKGPCHKLVFATLKSRPLRFRVWGVETIWVTVVSGLGFRGLGV